MATDQVFDLFSLDEANDINDTSGKVKKIEDTLDSIPSPSPSVKIQIMGGKGVEVNIAGHCQQTFCIQKFADNTQQ